MTLQHCSRQSSNLFHWNKKAFSFIRFRAVSARSAGSSSVQHDRKKKREEEGAPHFNPCGIQMISDSLHQQLFPDVPRRKNYPPEVVEKCRRHLEAHKLWGQKVGVAEPLSFQLPKLEGRNIDEHFRNIAREQIGGYRKLLDELMSGTVPEMPKTWAFERGWTKYHLDGTSESVPFPEEDALVFDVEVCMKEGQLPTLACAVSKDHWYSWCSESLICGPQGTKRMQYGVEDLIPLETLPGEYRPPLGEWREKIVVGHNVSYDRARVKEQFFMEKTKLRFLDTMSMHIAVSGITSYQRALKMTMQSKAQRDGTRTIPGADISSLDWDETSSLNNLADVHKLYCGGDFVKKDERNMFVKGTLKDIQDNFQSLCTYCANDVLATRQITSKVLPSFFERFPHPVTFSGMLEMSTTFLPINENWNKYMTRSEQKFHECEKEVKTVLMQKAEEALSLLEGERYKEDPWLWDLDWKVSKRRGKAKSLEPSKEQEYPAWYKKLLYKPSDPEYQPGPAKISSSMQVVPKLLRLTWCGFPLYHSKTGKWGFLIKALPKGKGGWGKHSGSVIGMESSVDEDSVDEDSNDSEEIVSNFPYKQWEEIYESSKAKLLERMTTSDGSTDLSMMKAEVKYKSDEMTQDLSDFLKGLEAVTGRSFMLSYPKDPNFGAKNSPHPLCEFVPLPHKNGAQYKVGNPLSKDFLSKIEEGILSCMNGQDIADKVVKLSKQSSYWRNNRDRIFGQMTVWRDAEDNNFGAIVPQVVVAGTLTRRAVEPTWMTASNAYADRIGSELKAMIQAPPSFNFVGADVDSQELWIASVIGDAHFAAQHGCTALGWMTLQGSKSAGTDMHSKTATVCGIGREQSKVLNYARIYGAGVRFAERLLMQFNRNMTASEAKQKARAMYQLTKGDRLYLLNDEGRELASLVPGFEDRLEQPLTKNELTRIMSYHHYPYREYMTLVQKLVWFGGTESFMFNRLEEIAQEETPQTPVLGALISRSLVPSVVHDDYMTSRVNWVVQSSAVDYLHLMLTCMSWLTKKFDLNARFCLSVHDEVRYLAHSEDKYQVALALQITNLLTRAFCSYRIGVYDLPQSVAFFSCIDVDKVLRKEVTDDCITPSNPDGLSATYNIPQGEALDIKKILEVTNGRFSNTSSLPRIC